MEPSSGKARPGRSRAACSACRAVKQKCSGSPARGEDCKRCQIYGLVCDYEGVVPHPMRSQAPALPPQPTAAAAPTAAATASRSSNFIPPTLNQTEPSVAAALREITERLRQIETGLEADRRRAGTMQPHSTAASVPLSTLSRAASSSNLPSIEMPAESNPLQILEQTISKIDAMSVGQSPPHWRGEDGAESAAPEGTQPAEAAGPPPPDAIVRGLVSIADCEAAFNFFHERIQPWISIMGNPDDRVPLLVQSRSPFLFHAILLVTNYYNTSTSDRAKEVYRGLTDILNTLLAWQILAPDPAQINSDLVRGLILLMYYKPVQHSALQMRRVTELGRVVHLSKVNALSSMMLHGLMHRTAELVGLTRAPDNFLAAIASTAGPPSLQILSDLRVHYWLCISDIQGSLQSGRASAADPTAALQTTRLFATIKAQPSDPRRAATLDLFAIVRTPKGARNASKIRLDNLSKINDDLAAWERHWRPILTEAQLNGDPLAYTVVQHSAQFVAFTVNSAVFTRWTIERQKSLDEGGNGRPTLTSLDWAHLQKAIDAAQKMMFAISVESTLDGSPLRSCIWPEAEVGGRPALRLDARTVEDYRTALDTTTCISFISSLILLVRITSSGLCSCDLECRRVEYEEGAGIHVPQLLQSARKLPRLLELGAAFLFAVSPNGHHPARKHSVLLQMILKAGLGEDMALGAGSTPNSTVSDPSPPSATPLPPLPLSSHASAGIDATTAEASSLRDPWLWNAGHGLSVSSDGGALLIPAIPELHHQSGAAEASGSAMASVLSGNDPFYSDFYSAGDSEIPGLTDDIGFSSLMDWGADATSLW